MITGTTLDGNFPTFSKMEDVFDYSWGRDMARFEKAKGVGTVGITTEGAFNAIYGPLAQNLAYNKHNTLAVLGQKPYKTGRRFQESLSMAPNQSSGVIRGGFAPQPRYGKYVQLEMPYKVLAHRFAMNLGMTDIGEKGIDDVLTWQQQVTNETDTWLYAQNNDVLRRVEDAPIVGQGGQVSNASDPFGVNGQEIVGLESIERIISNADEGKYVPAKYNVPWRLTADDSAELPSSDSGAAGFLNKYRNPNASGAIVDNNFNCYVDHNYNSETTTGQATLRQLTLPMIDNMFLGVMPYWNDNSTNGAVAITGYDTVGKMQMILQPQQRYQGQVRAQVDVNGIKTVEGQNTGFQVATYNGVPIIPDKQVARGDKDDPNAGIGRIYLTHSDILFNGVVKAPTFELTENSIIAGRYIRLADAHSISELAVDGPFRGLGKIIHLK